MSVGFEFRNNQNEVHLDSESLGMRLAHFDTIGRTFSGNLYIPKFNSDIGTFFIRPFVEVYSTYSGLRYDYDDDITLQNYNSVGTLGSLVRPTLSWNNALKIMTVTQNTSSDPQWEAKNVPHHLFCFHFI